ncbi:MAG: methylmalonyl Co-A mutase-associated GTPase MeaB [Cyanobacteria bacterium]|nr:methylmalonyl Co-A mutase-associated GTPase MeaB [Cyanobacteriota bacterium]
MGNLSNGILKADIKSAAKLMRKIEEEDIKAIEELKLLYSHTGHSHVIGITGLPGSGKSSLIDALIENFRNNNKTVGVIAVDPTSPFTGGSILGDRIRMQNHSNDEGVFIKSLPTKGWRGGISKVTSRMITVMDAMGKDIILVETAGVGQTEVEIKKLVHTTIVVLVGGLGDSIQAIKAGILEIADIFVINKADKIDAEELETDIYNLLSMSSYTENNNSRKWLPQICLTESVNRKGIDKLIREISMHENYSKSTGGFAQYFKYKSNNDLKEIIVDYLTNLIFKELENDELYKKLLDDLMDNKNESYSIAEEILNHFLKFKIKN